jgi:putative zinc finger/helix-turn-helix YgiT family protein
MNGKLCPICGEGHLREEQGDFTATLHDGEAADLVVPGITWFHCDSCGEDILDETAEAAISSARRRALGILSADELKQLRSRLGKSQSAMSELLGIGEKTYCRWESGGHFQTEAFDRYLRLLIEEPSNITILEEISERRQGRQMVRRGLVGIREVFGYLSDVRAVEELEQRFLNAMENGQLQYPQSRVN